LDEMRQIMAKVGNGDAVTNLDTTRRRKDGVMVPVLATYSPIRDASGKVVGITSISRDVTLLRQMEEEQLRSRVLEAKAKIREVLIDVIPLLMKRQVPEPERNDFILLLSRKLEEVLYDDYLGGMENVDLKTMGGVVANVLNDLGGKFTSEVNGDEIVVLGSKCPWDNDVRRNPVTCMLTKSISARFAKKAWGGAKVTVVQSLANKDDCCRIIIKRTV